MASQSSFTETSRFTECVRWNSKLEQEQFALPGMLSHQVSLEGITSCIRNQITTLTSSSSSSTSSRAFQSYHRSSRAEGGIRKITLKETLSLTNQSTT